jgi:pimeloyl-ACP methyl ester carboxylesterase
MKTTVGPSLLPAIMIGCLGIWTAAAALGQQPVRPIPPPGIDVPEQDAKQLAEGIQQLGGQIEILRKKLKNKPRHLALLPDVEIFHKSADWALRHREFFDPKQIAIAKEHILRGMQRAQELFNGKPSWTKATGLVVRGYVSAIDGSVQPYGLEIPEDWKSAEKAGRRLDFWMHGRGEKLSELAFIEERLKNKGEFSPQGGFVLHLYGRYCCANKFAGEVDLFEALAHAREHYSIDPGKLVVRGFSMGGASCWQFATHYGSLWAAAAPGAGFAESKEFLRLGTNPDKPLPAPWEQTLWRWYDSTVYAGNLANVPTIAYSGETDGQKQAADIMLKFLDREGLSVPHVIGPQTAHKYHPDSKREIEDFLAKAVADRVAVPEKIRFTTYTLIYPKMGWVEAEGLEQHWERADIVASLGTDGIEATTKNVSALSLHAGDVPRFAESKSIPVTIDGERLDVPVEDGRARLHRVKEGWRAGLAPSTGLRKQPGLCGPIDHAFMSSFVMVRPTGKPLHDTVGRWTEAEAAHTAEFWRKVFRGDAPVKTDTAVDDADMERCNLVLWGDPSSNAVIARILPQLPIEWTAKELRVAGATYDPSRCAPVLIYPNPLNPRRYVVINSGVTFREEALLNNANQIPKLPDWAVVDLDSPPDAVRPGKLLNAGFFGESWEFAQP